MFGPARAVASRRGFPMLVGVSPTESSPSATPEVRLPDFLAIGAMKCGTTTLYRDLLGQPGLYLPDKESNALLAADPAAALARLTAGAPADGLTGEVCPDYTKPGLDLRAAAAARQLYAGRRAPRLIFLAREPIARLLSHHHFISTQQGAGNPGGMTRDLAASLRDFPELIETSRYAARLAPWVEAFGRESLLVLRFEDYIADRAGTLGRIAAFIGHPGFAAARIEARRVYNAGVARPVATPGWRRVLGHTFYRRWVRPLLPIGLRDHLRDRLLPKAPPRPSPPDREWLRELAESLKPDVAALSRLLGQDEPLWDLDRAVETLAAGEP